MKRKIILGLEVLAGLAFLVFLGLLIKGKLEDRAYAQREAQDQEVLAAVLDPDPEDQALPTDEEAIERVQGLKADYPDLVAIIDIPGTGVRYPVFQAQDNSFYLNHNREGEDHVFGEVFMDSRNKADFTNENTVIYGHNNRRTQDLFHELIQYESQDFYESHKSIHIYSLSGFMTFEVTSAFRALPQEDYRVIDFPYNEDYLAFLKTYAEKSLVQTGFGSMEDKEARRSLTLSTCYDKRERFVIQALEVLED